MNLHADSEQQAISIFGEVAWYSAAIARGFVSFAFSVYCLAGNDLLNISLLKGTNSPNFPLVKAMTFYDDKVLWFQIDWLTSMTAMWLVTHETWGLVFLSKQLFILCNWVKLFGGGQLPWEQLRSVLLTTWVCPSARALTPCWRFVSVQYAGGGVIVEHLQQLSPTWMCNNLS